MPEPRITSPRTPGFTLRNGAILLAEKDANPTRRVGVPSCTVVLAFAPGTYQPFCVWSRDRSVDGADVTFDGDYYTDLDDAVAAWKERTR